VPYIPVLKGRGFTARRINTGRLAFRISASTGTRQSFGFRFFEAEDVELTVGTAHEDQLESLRECAAKRIAVAGEGSKDFFGFELSHLQRLVKRRGAP
jgi:hypothetical protein